uniref:Uncharacterized protein n=1 Tax=Opuntia streptacantha TaxID=393608 RepID=A0A7C9DRH7_OPUST
MVNTERLLPKDATLLVPWFADEPTSRLEVRSSVRFVMRSDLESRGITRKPDGNKGASSGNISSIGAKTSSEQTPIVFSSIPLHICKRWMSLDMYASSGVREWPSSRITSNISSFSIVWPRGIIIWLPVNLVALIPEKAYEPAFKAAAE